MSAIDRALEALYADPNLAVTAEYASLLGSAFTVPVMRSCPQQEFAGIDARASLGSVQLTLRRSDVPSPVAGDRLTVSGITYRIDGVEPDRQALEWRLAVTELP